MRAEGRTYYVGILKAAELHGATHQAIMEFQVVTDKRLPSILSGRSTISFHYRKDIAALAGAIEHRAGDVHRPLVVDSVLLEAPQGGQAEVGLEHLP
jgi:hypothetical protein